MEERSTTEEVGLLLKYISKGYIVPDILHDEVMNAAKREIEEKRRVVLIKRDPNTHRGRIQAVYAKIIDGSTIEIHPCTVGPFMADFDGDSIYGRLRCTTRDLELGQITEIECYADELIDKLGIFEFKSETKKENKIIKKYSIKSGYKLSIKSINVNDGKSSYNEITEYSIHENIEMYKIQDRVGRFEPFWASSDHSMIVYDEIDGTIKKISPKLLLDNPKGKYLIKST